MSALVMIDEEGEDCDWYIAPFSGGTFSSFFSSFFPFSGGTCCLSCLLFVFFHFFPFQVELNSMTDTVEEFMFWAETQVHSS